jgi:hypothetical protein
LSYKIRPNLISFYFKLTLKEFLLIKCASMLVLFFFDLLYFKKCTNIYLNLKKSNNSIKKKNFFLIKLILNFASWVQIKLSTRKLSKPSNASATIFAILIMPKSSLTRPGRVAKVCLDSFAILLYSKIRTCRRGSSRFQKVKKTLLYFMHVFCFFN